MFSNCHSVARRRNLRSTLLQILSAVLLVAAASHLHAQAPEPALSDAEVEILRESAPLPVERIQAFVGFLNDRTKAIDKLLAGRRKPGREEDIHDLMEQFSSIANDLSDNLDEYDKRHKDMRKALPKLLAATDRWATALRSPPDHEAYNVARRLALESLAEVKTYATDLTKSQQEYFLAHPPPKDASPGARGI